MKRIFFLLTFISIFFQVKTEYILITTLYNETNKKRIIEYLYCLKKNITHPLIESIHIFYDTTKDIESYTPILDLLKKQQKITLSYISRRATFQDCFDIANNQFPHKKIIIANADIYFNNTLSLLNNYNLQNKFLALTRWDLQKDGTIKPYRRNGMRETIDSQDVWIFTTPLKKFKKADFKLGTPRCDNCIAFRANQVGLHVLNPCKTIQCIHVHDAPARKYLVEYVDEPILQLRWSFL